MADVANEIPPMVLPVGEDVFVDEGKKSKRGKRASRANKDISTESFPEQAEGGKGDENSKKRRSRRAGKGRKREETSSPELGASVCQSAEVTCDSVVIEKAVASNTTSSKSRRSRKNKHSKGDAGPEAAKASLSQEELAFIKKIQERSLEPLKIGSISLAELMGTTEQNKSGSNLLQRLIEKPLNVQTILEAAAKERPPVPGFSRGYPNQNYNVRPELLHTAMDVFRNASQNYQGSHGHDNRFARPMSPRSNQRGDFRPEIADRLPWIPLTPMYPFEDRHQRTALNLTSPVSRRNPQHLSYRSFSNHNNINRNGPPMTSSSSHSIAPPASQKTRKPFFMPYYSGEYVSRGLATGELIKGSLRVNQRNYEESYIDNPEGDDQLDLLILGLHDRNRALHGDVVVVRLKDRSSWVVRESLYQAWRSGHLDMSQDDDGKPMTVPPVPAPHDDNVIEVFLGGTAEVKVAKSDLGKDIPVSDDMKYDRLDMILMGAQSELSRRGKLAGGGDGNDLTTLEPNLQELIESLSLGRVDSRVPPQTPVRRTPARRALGQSTKKCSYKLLCEMPAEDWGVPDFCLQKTAEVVFIAEQKNCRAAMGQLRVMSDGNRNWALFGPNDSRMPRMMIPADQAPVGFFERPQDFAKFIFVARVVEWQATAQFARGRLERSLGLAGDVDAEAEGLLFSNDADTREFSNEVLHCLPETGAWSIPEEELKTRVDLRDEAVFSIVNKDSKSVEVATHISKKEDKWEVGVHIADVSFFVKEGTELDKWAAKRANVVSLVHKEVPMLPRALSEDLCSFIPDADRLAFSVIWELDSDANVLSEKFVRSVVRSKASLSCGNVSGFLKGAEDDISSGSMPSSDLKDKISALHSLAGRLGSARLDKGSLCLDEATLKFVLDQEKVPVEVSLSEKSTGERMMEEFVILANMSVARVIENACPKTALLLRHPSPKQKVMREMEELCEKIGFPIHGATSSALASSLKAYADNDKLHSAIYKMLCLLLKKPMQAEQYFCIGTQTSPASYFHYTLGCPYYTHFTSPTKRYADVLVHRFLASTLGCGKAPSMSIQEIERCAQHCNDKKVASLAVSEGSQETFFGMFVQRSGPFEEPGVVVGVTDSSIDVLLLKYGICKRVYVNKLDIARDPVFVEGAVPKLTLFWHTKGPENAAVEQLIQISSVINVTLSALPEPTKFQAVIKMDPSNQTLHELLEYGVEL